MSENYVREKLFTAVHTLATSALPLQQRLEGAMVGSLIRLNEDDFADAEARERFAQITAALTARDAQGDEGSIRASTAAMSDDDAEQVARQILELHGLYFPLRA